MLASGEGLKIDRLVNRYRFENAKQKKRAFFPQWLNSLCIQTLMGSLVDRLMEKQIKLITFEHRNDINKKNTDEAKAQKETDRPIAARMMNESSGEKNDSRLRRQITWEEWCTSRRYGLGAKAKCLSVPVCSSSSSLVIHKMRAAYVFLSLN